MGPPKEDIDPATLIVERRDKRFELFVLPDTTTTVGIGSSANVYLGSSRVGTVALKRLNSPPTRGRENVVSSTEGSFRSSKLRATVAFHGRIQNMGETGSRLPPAILWALHIASPHLLSVSLHGERKPQSLCRARRRRNGLKVETSRSLIIEYGSGTYQTIVAADRYRLRVVAQPDEGGSR